MSSGQSHRKPSGWVCHRNLGSFSRAFQLALESLSGKDSGGGNRTGLGGGAGDEVLAGQAGGLIPSAQVNPGMVKCSSTHGLGTDGPLEPTDQPV